MIEVTVEMGRCHRMRVVGGDPKGGCPLHRMISKWPGWRRSRERGTLSNGDAASVFTAPLYPHTAVDFLKLDLREVKCTREARALINKVAESIEWAKIDLEDPNPKPLTQQPIRPLYPHQTAAVRAAVKMGLKVLIADDMGVGKTSTALACFIQCPAERLLVVCPASVKGNWVNEVRTNLGDEPMVHLIDGTKPKRKKIMDEIVLHFEEGGVVIINYDLLPHLSPRDAAILMDWANHSMVILDESHYIKGKDSKRSKWCRENLHGAYYRICLTGTPVRNLIDDLYCQADFLRPGMWASYNDFCRRYLVQVKITMGNRSFFETKGTKNHAELNRLVNTFQIRRSKEEVLDLPPKVRTCSLLDLDNPTRRIYKAMKEWALLELVELDANAPVFQPKAATASDAFIRCEQIAQGFVGGIPEGYKERMLPLLVGHAESIPGRPEEMIFPKSAKIRYTLERIEDVLAQGGAPVVIGNYNGPLTWMNNKHHKDFGFLHGGIPAAQRTEMIAKFQAGELRGMFLQVKIAEGFNLTRSHDVIFHGRDWSPAINAQAEDRCHRIGTTGTVNIQVPVVAKTIEEHIHKRLAAKAEDAEAAIKNLTVGQLREIL